MQCIRKLQTHHKQRVSQAHLRLLFQLFETPFLLREQRGNDLRPLCTWRRLQSGGLQLLQRLCLLLLQCCGLLLMRLLLSGSLLRLCLLSS